MNHHRGFTLIEISIALVIIGLLVGGVIVGQSLIASAQLRSQMTQIEKYRLAVNAFRSKYSCLPGDCRIAESIGFTARGNGAGQGDGDTRIRGFSALNQRRGETVLFWRDLSTAGLISEQFTIATAATDPDPGNPITETSSPALVDLIPRASIGRGNYVYVWSGGVWAKDSLNQMAPTTSDNYFGLSAVQTIEQGKPISSEAGLSPLEAYGIDSKTDDGFPQSGKVIAYHVSLAELFIDVAPSWAMGGPSGSVGANSGDPTYGPTTSDTPISATTCYHNTGAGTAQIYSTASADSAMNCALSMQF